MLSVILFLSCFSHNSENEVLHSAFFSTLLSPNPSRQLCFLLVFLAWFPCTSHNSENELIYSTDSSSLHSPYPELCLLKNCIFYFYFLMFLPYLVSDSEFCLNINFNFLLLLFISTHELYFLLLFLSCFYE